MNRTKILAAFEKVPSIIEMAQNKADAFPLDGRNQKSVRLHQAIQELFTTLLGALPALINILIPTTLRKTEQQREH